MYVEDFYFNLCSFSIVKGICLKSVIDEQSESSSLNNRFKNKIRKMDLQNMHIL